MPRTRRDRRRAFFRGHAAEHWAALYLVLCGYRLAAIRYKTRAGEIDIIARKGDMAVFVEVKSRRILDDALAAISYNSESRIRRASEIWLSHQHDGSQLASRYDVIAIRPWRLPKHFINCF